MSPKSNQPNLLTAALVLLCVALAAVLVLLLLQIAELTLDLPAVQARQSDIVVTPTPLATVPAATATPTSEPTATALPSATPLPTATATPIPTRTPRPTRTPSPTATPTPLPLNRPTAVPVDITVSDDITNTYPIPTAVPRYPISEEAITVVLLGSDRRPDWEHWNTDAIQLAIIYPKIPSVALLSIPRDLYVYIPQFKMNRINVADMVGETYGFDGGGFGLLNQTLLYNLGITADYYAKVNFQGLKDIVDILGGIDVPVYCHLQDYWPYPDENGVYQIMALEPGIQHMDGRLALWYSRTRKTTSVFDREERQQQVLEAIWRKAREGDLLSKIPALYDQYGQIVDTDLEWARILSLGLIAARIEASQVMFYNIGSAEVTPYTTSTGGFVYLPQWDKIAPVIDRAMLPPAESRAALASVKVEVWNGSSQPQWELLASDRLYTYGFTPVLGESDGQAYPLTQIQVFGEHAKGTGISIVQEVFGVSDAQVTYLGASSDDIKLRLILGADYHPCR